MSEYRWRTSSYTGTNGNCVELSNTLDRVRDSKNPTGPILRGDMTALIRSVKQGLPAHVVG